MVTGGWGGGDAREDARTNGTVTAAGTAVCVCTVEMGL